MSFIYSIKKERFRSDASIYEIGDYVAYKQGELENDAVAQVIGRPGDVVIFKKGQVLVNGQVLALPKMIGAIEVPEGERQPIERTIHLSNLRC